MLLQKQGESLASLLHKMLGQILFLSRREHFNANSGSNEMKGSFQDAKVQICEICHRVTKCHVLFEDDNCQVLVCGLCDSE